MFFKKIRDSILSIKSKSSNNSLECIPELPKLNFDYKLKLDLYCMDKLIIDIFTDLKNEGFIVDYHM